MTLISHSLGHPCKVVCNFAERFFPRTFFPSISRTRALWNFSVLFFFRRADFDRPVTTRSSFVESWTLGMFLQPSSEWIEPFNVRSTWLLFGLNSRFLRISCLGASFWKYRSGVFQGSEKSIFLKIPASCFYRENVGSTYLQSSNCRVILLETFKFIEFVTVWQYFDGYLLSKSD